MKSTLRPLLALGLALLLAATARAAAVLNVTGVSAASSVAPGQSATFNVSVANSGALTPGDDFPAGGSLNVTLVLTNTITQFSFTVTGVATTIQRIPGGGGAGTLAFSAVIPTAVTEGGSYSGVVTIGTVSAAGSGATGVAAVSADGVTSASVTGGGSGYTGPFTVTFSGGGGVNATGTATVSGGAVTGIAITAAGTGYTSAPAVVLTAGGGTGASATANIRGVTSISVTSGGSSYQVAPVVNFTGGGGGTGAVGTATVSGGVVTAVTVTASGANYTSAPTISFTANDASVGTSSVSVSTPVITILGTPDLQITSLTYGASTTYVGGDVIPMSITYINRTRSPGATINNTPWVPATPGNASFFRIQIVLSSNPIFGDADDFRLTFTDRKTKLNADNITQTFAWNQLVPGNFAGSYYVLAKIDVFDTNPETIENDFTINGNNIWLDVNAPRFTIQPTNFATNYLASTTAGGSGNGYSDNPAASGDGRYTVFASDATNLVAGDSNGTRDIFIFDNQTVTTRRLNLSRQGAQANGPSNRPAISTDGRFVAFESAASNLVLGDTNAFSDIFVVDSVTGSLSLVSVGSTGTQGNNSSFRPSISGTGRFVSFESTANNLTVPAVATGGSQIYLRDRDVSGSGIFDTPGNTTTILVSRSTAGVAGSGGSLQSVVSSDGRYVAFASDSANLVSGDTNASRDVFLRDRTLGTTIRASVSSTGGQGSGASRAPSISADGRYIAFDSSAPDLVAGDTNGVSDIFVYDRVAAATVRVSVSTGGTEAADPSASGAQLGSLNPSISASGRFVAFGSLANNLTPGDAAGQSLASDANLSFDIFVRDRDTSGSGTFDTVGNVATTMASLNKFGMQTLVVLGQQSTASSDISPAISADGRWVAFPSDTEGAPGLSHTTTNLISQDANNARDIFVYDRRTNALPGASTAPAVTLTGPGAATTILVNTAVPITASATAPIGVVASVQFFVNGTSVGSSSSFPYGASWTPTAVGRYVLSAIVTDSFGNLGVSTNVNVSVNAAPSVGITSPSAASSVLSGTTQTVSATAAASTPGATVTGVQFSANNVILGNVTAPPYSISWTPSVAGVYTLRAVATDNFGITGTATTQVTVTSPAVPPTVTLTSPATSMAVALNAALSLAATASDSDGTVASVRFLANGVPISTKTAPPYTATFTPTTVGSYSIVAQATDNGGNITDSAPQVVTVLGGFVPDAIYAGDYAGGSERGRFAVINIGGKAAAFIGYSVTSPARAYFYPNLAVDTSGGFGAAPAIVGRVNDTGVSGSFDSSRLTFIGPIAATPTSTVASGYYTGNIANRSNSTLAAIVGTDGAITVYVSDGAFADAGAGSVDASGNFNLGLGTGARLVGRANPATGFLSGTLVGGPGGTVMAALASGGAFSDGSLRNLSTRGQVGAGNNVMIAGFVVGGTTPKRVLVRAIGPTLSSGFGLAGALADPQLQLFRGTTSLLSNNDWAGDPAIVTASSVVGAFPLADNSLDAVILARLEPGAYTAQVSGVGGLTGLALVELYDVDAPGAFSPQKLVNVATRGVVGAGENILIAGFVVGGTTPKRVLVRGVGPSLASLLPAGSTPGALTDPILQIIRSDRGDRTVVRENDNWEIGNDVTLVTEASARVGAFPLTRGSRDAVLLISLPPGTYSATVGGVGGATGVGIVEVYEVP